MAYFVYRTLHYTDKINQRTSFEHINNIKSKGLMKPNNANMFIMYKYI